MEQVKKTRAQLPLEQTAEAKAGKGGARWKANLKHSMRGASYQEGMDRLRPGSAPVPETQGDKKPEAAKVEEKKPEEKPFDTADPELREKHQENSAISYENYAGDLFLNGISATDVQQGAIADCYLGSALAAIAASDPKLIEDMITKVGRNKYEVRFYKKSYYGPPKSTKITIDGDLPTKSKDMLYTKGADKNDNGVREMWPALIEKAYAQWKGGYDDIGEGGYSGDVMTAITGKPSKYRQLATMKNDELWNMVTKALDKGQPVTCGTHGKDAAEDQQKSMDEAKVYAWHAYTVMSYSEKKSGENTERYVQLRNPWGKANRDTTYADKGIFSLKFDLFKQAYSSIVINGKKTK